MSLNITTQDLENYPGETKTVNLDLNSVVPTGYEGDEKIVLNISTNAYSDNEDRTKIQDKYITGFKSGWCKSSGLKGSGGKFPLDSDHYKLKISLDSTVSGSDGTGFYEIDLNYSSTPISGEDIAADMEEKIRELGDSLHEEDTGFELAYKTCKVEYKNGKFWIVSGSLGNSYTGSYRTAAKVEPASEKDASGVLGFDLSVDSNRMSYITAKETKLSSSYTAGTETLEIVTGTGADVGDSLMITDGENTDYFTVLSGTESDTSIRVATFASNNYDGIINDYDVDSSKIQVLREQDSDGKPASAYTDFDAVARQGLKLIMCQIDYSS